MKKFIRLTLILSLLAASASHAQVGLRQIQSNGMPITLVYPTAATAQHSARQKAFDQIALFFKQQL
ncbi:MAG: hypothetical protein CFE39_17100 [Comamonadaceae bacterium PBBC2]|nr:MAG: hypothetical protein CFE39_17100 [Comamonadaceae bacterium PBBC2]